MYRRKKNLLMIVLVCVLILNNIFVVGGAAQQAEVLQKDSTLVEKLYSLELIDGDDENLDEYVTREKYAAILVRFLNMHALAQSMEEDVTCFVDVPANSDYVKEISLIKEMGYLKGSKYVNSFYPKNTLKLADAVDMMANAFGYGIVNSSKAGSVKANMVKGLSVNSSGNMTFYDVYKLLDNCLELTCVVADGNTMYIDKDVTVMQTFHQIHKGKGKVTANPYTSLTDSNGGTNEGQIEIGGVVYDCSYTDGVDILGMDVEYYAKFDADENLERVLYIEVKNLVEIYEFDVEDVTVTNSKITYRDEKNKKRDLEFDTAYIDIIYNGKAYTGYGSISSIIPERGMIKAISNGGNKIDVLFIYEYQNLRVAGVDYELSFIYDEFTGSKLELEDALLYDENGKRIEITEIQKADVLSVFTSKNEIGDKLVMVRLTRSNISGTVAQIEREGTDAYYYIDDVAYEIADEFQKTLCLGDTGVFYLDLQDRIVCVDPYDESQYKYAAMRKIRPTDWTRRAVKVEAFTHLGMFEELNIANKVKINGTFKNVKNEGADAVQEVLQPSLGHVFKYRLNSGGEICELYFVYEDEEDGKLMGRTEKHDVISTGDSYLYKNGILDASTAILSTTLIFAIPEDLNDEEGFAMVSTSHFAADTKYTGKYYSYASANTKANVAAAVELKNFSAIEFNVYSDSFLLITATKHAVNGDLETVEIIEGMCGGLAVSYETDRIGLCAEKNLCVGDVIRPTKRNGKIIDVEVVYSSSGEAEEPLVSELYDDFWKTATWSSSYRVIYTTVEDINGNFVSFKASHEDEAPKMSVGTLYSKAMFYKMLNSTAAGEQEVQLATVNDLTKGDTVLLRVAACSIREVIIMR